LAVQILHARQNGREKIAKFVIGIRAELWRCAELVGQMAGDVLEMVTERRGGDFNLALRERGGNLVPYLQVRLDQRAGVDRPAMERQGRLGRDKTGGLHLLGP